MNHEDLVSLTADIVAAHVSSNSVSIRDVGGLIAGVHKSLAGLGTHPPEAARARMPMVSARASITPDHLICLACGDRLKLLRRHIQRMHGFTPDEYRKAFGLRANYPMVSPNYAQLRGELARASGLGHKGMASRNARKH